VADGPHGIDGITRWMGLRWDSAQTVRLALRPELLNSAGRLSGVVAYTLVDYSMGSTLWIETTDEESIATLSITVTYLRTATEGEIVCNSRLDRRTRSNAALRSEVLDDQGQVIATAVGTYAIFPRRR